MLAAVYLLPVVTWCSGVAGITLSYGVSARELFAVAPTLWTVLLASWAVSVLYAGLLFAPVPVGRHHRLWVFASAVAMASVNLVSGNVTFVFWLAPLWPLWRFYREGTA